MGDFQIFFICTYKFPPNRNHNFVTLRRPPSQITHNIISERYSYVSISVSSSTTTKKSWNKITVRSSGGKQRLPNGNVSLEILSKAHINLLCEVSRRAHIFWLMHSLSCLFCLGGQLTLVLCCCFFFSPASAAAPIWTASQWNHQQTCAKSRLVLATELFPLLARLLTGSPCWSKRGLGSTASGGRKSHASWTPFCPVSDQNTLLIFTVFFTLHTLAGSFSKPQLFSFYPLRKGPRVDAKAKRVTTNPRTERVVSIFTFNLRPHRHSEYS